MVNGRIISGFLFCLMLFANQISAKDTIQVYFSNDSINGLKISDAYETHNMGVIYSAEQYYFKLDLGIVSPDMHVYRNQYREANRSFAELISLEIGYPDNANGDLRFYARIKATGEFGVDKLQDFAHRFLSLKQVNDVNDLIRMQPEAWAGIGLRREIESSVLEAQDTKLSYDGFLGSDTTFLYVKLTKEFHRRLFRYDMSVSGRFIAYDEVVSASPINARERKFIPEVSFGVSYDSGPYTVFVKDSFSLPSIESDNSLYGVLSAGVSYKF